MRFTIYVIPLLLSSLIMAFLSVRTWPMRKTTGPVASIFSLLTATLAIGPFLYVIELALSDYPLMVTLARLRFVMASFAPVIWWWFAVRVTKRYHWIHPGWVVLSSLLPLLSVIVYWTNDVHHLFYSSLTLAAYDQISVLVNTKGPWSSINLAVSSVLIISGLMLVGITNKQTLQRYRWQDVVLVGGIALFLGLRFLYTFGLFPIDYSAAVLCIPVVLVGWSGLRLELDWAMPAARNVVVEHMVDPVFVTSADDIVLDFNHAAQALFGDPKPLRGSRLSEMLPAVAEPLRAGDAASRRQASPDVTLTTRQGTRIFNVQSSVLQGRSGFPYGHVTILRDITLEKQNELRILQQNIELIKSNEALLNAREAAEAASKLKSDFLATMSHELRTPLHAIMGYTDLLIASLQGTGTLTDSQQEISQRIMRSNERLLGIIDGILDMSRIEAGRMTLQYKTIATQLWVDTIRLEIQPQVDRKGLAFHAEIDPQMPAFFKTDIARLRQLTMNLLSNALKFTSEGSISLTIRQFHPPEASLPSLQADSPMLEICVTDTGIGIAAEHHQAIFENFYQIDGGATRRYGGIGLGLAIVHKLTTIMGGHVFVESAPNRGSTFTVRLPLQYDVDSTADIPANSVDVAT